MSLLSAVRDRQRIRKAARATRLPGGLPGDGRAPRPWWVDMRIEGDDLALVRERLVLEREREVPGQPFGVARTHAAEWEVTVEVDATTEAIAERLGRRLMERLNVPVLAARAYQRSARR